MAERILQKVAAGEPGAVEACMAHYRDLIWSLAQRFSPNEADAEDAVQEVYMDLWKHAKRFDPSISSEVTFVAMIARRKLIDRRRQRARQIPTTNINEAMVVAVTTSWNGMELSDEIQKIREQFALLRHEERQVLEMAICQGLTQTQISERTGMPLGTVKTHARKGLIRLRSLVADAQAGVTGGEQ